jgi:hypothetical protein
LRRFKKGRGTSADVFIFASFPPKKKVDQINDPASAF